MSTRLTSMPGELPPLPALPGEDDQRFDKIRKAGAVYVDKTRFIQQMVSGRPHTFFCARPRRFGKSLMVTTLESFFRGEKSLFQGLAIHDYMESAAFSEHPVISLDMSGPPASQGIQALNEGLAFQIKVNAKRNGVPICGENPTAAFGNLIFDTCEKSGPIALLIDEYDDPMLKTLGNDEIQEQVRAILRDFYTTIKVLDKMGCIRFVYLTGISKFSKLGVFSGLNNVRDISFKDEYATMLGYTEKEIIENYAMYITAAGKKLSLNENILMERLREYYDGYFFGGKENVYNPLSIALFFENNKFAPYWIETGSQEFIEKFLSRRKISVGQFENFSISPDMISSPGEITRSLAPEFLLYQAGYLTVRTKTIDDKEYNYLTYPNYEVRAAMVKLRSKNFFKECQNIVAIQQKFVILLNKSAYAEALLEFNEVFERLPYDDSIDKDDVEKTHAHYRGPLIGFLYGSEVFVDTESHSNRGRSDIVFECGGKSYVIEFKVAVGERKCRTELFKAMTQIVKGNYTGRFADPLAIGIVVDEKVRLITHICIETDVYRVVKRKLQPMGKLKDLKIAKASKSRGK
ncbi:MAG: ATP-binding protein [Desulfovibrio sp.]|nr:ATP-binding protein [Desulfovibrio sp.]